MSTRPFGSTCAWMPTFSSVKLAPHWPRTSGVSMVKVNGDDCAAVSSPVVTESMSVAACRNVVS